MGVASFERDGFVAAKFIGAFGNCDGSRFGASLSRILSRTLGKVALYSVPSGDRGV